MNQVEKVYKTDEAAEQMGITVDTLKKLIRANGYAYVDLTATGKGRPWDSRKGKISWGLTAH
jgi:hypothetical protein